VASVADAFDREDPSGVEQYRDLLTGGPDSAPSYQATTLQRSALLDFLDGATPASADHENGDNDDDDSDRGRVDVGVLGASQRLSSAITARPTVSPAHDAPGPPPTLRISPGHRQTPPPTAGGPG
jgi:hypothetical protein